MFALLCNRGRKMDYVEPIGEQAAVGKLGLSGPMSDCLAT